MRACPFSIGEVFAIAVQPQGEKIVRADSQAASIEGGRVLPLEGAVWLGNLEKEVLAFPYGRHDDQVDNIDRDPANWSALSASFSGI